MSDANSPAHRDAPVLAARQVSKHFGGVTACEDVTIEFPAGSVTAIVGDNGAGKTTLVKMLCGVLRPDSGYIEVDGAPAQFGMPEDARRAGIETVYQDLALADHRDVAQNLFLGRELTRSFGPIRLLAVRRMREQSREILSDLSIRLPDVTTEVRKLSGGQRQGVAIGRAVHWGYRILIMDEPMAALGLQESRRVMELVEQLAGRGLTQIVISHNLDHVFSLATRVAVMRHGSLVGVRDIAGTTREDVFRMISGIEASSG